MTGVIVHPSQALDNLGHARQRPQIRVKTVRPRALSERLVHLPQMGRLQLRLAARAPCAPQSRGSAVLPLSVPTCHTLPTHFQFASDGCEDQLTGCKQAGRLFAATRKALKIPAWRYRHTDSIDRNCRNVTIFCEIVTVLCDILIRGDYGYS